MRVARVTPRPGARQSVMDDDEQRGRALLLIGVVALCRSACVEIEAPRADVVGEPIPIRLEQLSGDEWRLLPGVGEVLGARLEQARLAAGGSLDERGVDAVSGVGPALLARWRRLVTR